jgi:signal peptidase II
MTDNTRNARLFWTTAIVIVAFDVWTKHLAVAHLAEHFPKQVFGDVLRWTLAYNPGAAFSMSLGPPIVSRIVFGAFATIALYVLWRIYRDAKPNDWPRVLGVALAWGGAAGNLIDRIRSARGVVDFIDVGIGSTRFWTFNIADSAVTCGAILLAIVLWREDSDLREQERVAALAPVAVAGAVPDTSAALPVDETAVPAPAADGDEEPRPFPT